MLVELSVVEQRYHAVMEVVCGGVAVVEVAETLWGVAQDKCTAGCVVTAKRPARAG